jgi:sugar O-acyltransferase (sialic acid O-acetyltransferase NeuD family)
MTKDIVIIGNGELAKTLAQHLYQDERFNIMYFAIEKKFIKKKKIFQTRVIDFLQLNKLLKKKNFYLINGIGYQQNNLIREKIQLRLARDFKFITYIHLESYVSKFAKVSAGSIIMPNATVEAGSNIGLGNVIWSNVVVGHGSKIGNFCWLSAGCVIGGNSTVKKNSFIGINASISNKITIGEKNIIGINTAIQKNTNKNSVFITKQGEKINIKSDVYAKFFLK